MRHLALGLLALYALACGDVIDVCDTGPCECAVETEATDCGAHQYCNATESGRTCECAAGYSGTDTCVWSGALQDPGFAGTGWTAAGGAAIDPAKPGAVDPGEAVFSPESLCALGTVQQTIEMPTFAKGEPLVLDLSYRNTIDFDRFDSVALGVSFGGGWSVFPASGDAAFVRRRICLPEGAYAPRTTVGAGAPVTIAFGPFQQPSQCPNMSLANFAIDHAAIVPADPGECSATPGEGVNFDAEGEGGWVFALFGSSQGGFVDGVGANGSRGARATLGRRCDSATMSTMINVPDVAGPALDMFIAGSAGASITIDFGLGSFGQGAMLPFGGTLLTAQTGTFHTCLPPALRGQTLTATFTVSNIASGPCDDVLNHQVVADQVRVVDDPACATEGGVVDRSFEQGGPPFASSGTMGTSTAQAVVRNTGGEPLTGARFLALESYGRCSRAAYTMMPTVPPPNGAAGPALKFFAKVGLNNDAETTVGTAGQARQTLVEGGGYREYTTCLNPRYAGRPQFVFLEHYGGSGLCDNSNYVQQSALIDDVSITTDPACPAM